MPTGQIKQGARFGEQAITGGDFASGLTPPVVEGPKVVSPGEEVTWTCTTDFVATPTGTEADVDFSLEIVNAGYLHVALMGPILTDVTQEEVKG